MNDAAKFAQQSRARRDADAKHILVVLLVVVAVVIVGVFAFLKFYSIYIDRILYAERLSQMQEVTKQLFSGLEDAVENQWNTAEIQCNYLELGQPETLDELLHFMSKQRKLNDLEQRHCNLVAIDSKGLYYTPDGLQGAMGGMDYLLGEPEYASYVFNTLTTGESWMLFLQKLPQPITVRDGEKTITLTYYGVSRSMLELTPYFNCSAYDGNNSVYVLDPEGLKLFSSGDDLIHGFNAYTVLSNMGYLHGSSFDAARTSLEETGAAYSNAVLDGEEVYYALYRMEHSDWTLLFLIPSEYVASDTVRMVNTTIRALLGFSFILVAVAALTVFWVLRRQQRTALETERRNNEALAAVNKNLAEAVQEAETANRAKSDFLANMSHDIRTPMNAIVGVTDLMECEPDLSPKLRSYIHKVHSSSRHLLSLINDILDMSKIEASDVRLNTEPVSLCSQIEQVDSIIRSQANERKQTFLVRTHALRHEFWLCDSVRLRQLLLNLLSNAVKYTPVGGSVWLDITERPCDEEGCATLIFTVTDNGCGMSEEFQKHIFEPFTRAEDSVTNKVQGTGLGMAITKKIVDMAGGEIRLQSAPGRGSRFDVTLTFPFDTLDEPELAVSQIMVVRGEQALLENIRDALHDDAVTLVQAKTIQEAAALLRKQPVDVLLLCGALYDPALAENARLLREAAGGTLRVYCVDSVQNEQPHPELAQCGVDGLISLPFFRSKLCAALAQNADGLTANAADEHILKGMHFLCAEDNALNAEILSAMLELHGASCRICHDGEEIVQAFETVQPGEYDAILMDIQMPKMNGLDAARRIRSGKNPLGAYIPIIAMTANAFSEDIQNSIDAGMDAHISKPIDFSLLEKAMRQFVPPPPRVRGK